MNLKIFSLPDIPNYISSHRLTAGLILAILILLIGGFFIYQKIAQKPKPLLADIDLNFDPEGPYAILTPRRDGYALILNAKRVASYDSFAYQLVYVDKQGIDRSAGFLDTWINLKNKKSDFEQELLFGTCSQGFTSGKAHCSLDEGVENGTLVLRIRKGQQPYRMLSQWHLQKPDVALGVLTSGDNHFSYTIKAKREDLNLIGFSVVNDLNGVPKLPEGRQVLGKVYSLNAPLAKELPAGSVGIELSENPPADAKIERFVEKQNSWDELTTKISGSKLTTEASGSGIFAVLVNKK